LQKNLDDLDLFYQLKDAVLKKYKQTYPYWSGNLTSFGNKEIAQLLDLIETETRQRISEKWVYTHLKPTSNTKLPRKDMLDILSIWVDYSGWDEFKVKKVRLLTKNSYPKVKKRTISVILIGLGVFGVLLSSNFFIKTENSVCFYDQYTQKIISSTNFSVFTINNKGDETQQQINDGCIHLKNGKNKVQLKITSPYYKDADFDLLIDEEQKTIVHLQPDDYAMMLRAYMNSNVVDWERRRSQLDKVIIDEAEIIEIMNEDIGVEFLNKGEFIDKITIPLESTKRMEIIDIEYNPNNQIIRLKFIQKDKNE